MLCSVVYNKEYNKKYNKKYKAVYKDVKRVLFNKKREDELYESNVY